MVPHWSKIVKENQLGFAPPSLLYVHFQGDSGVDVSSLARLLHLSCDSRIEPLHLY
jgi:hypothetical protein